MFNFNCMCRGGLVGDHERYSATAALLSKGLESWGDQTAAAGAGASMAALKEEGSGMPHAGYNFYGSHLAGGDHEMPAAGGAKSQLSQMLLASSPRSCITSLGSNMLDFSNSAPAPELRSHHHHSDNSSEVRSD